MSRMANIDDSTKRAPHKSSDASSNAINNHGFANWEWIAAIRNEDKMKSVKRECDAGQIKMSGLTLLLLQIL
jgi:hypothetical protein